jgi:hypothetical protein
MSDLINLQPANGVVDSLKPVIFTVTGGNPTSFIGIWLRYEGSDEELLVSDGVDFLPLFAANSSKVRPFGDDALVNYSIVPEGGWQSNLARIRVQGFPTIVTP